MKSRETETHVMVKAKCAPAALDKETRENAKIREEVDLASGELKLDPRRQDWGACPWGRLLKPLGRCDNDLAGTVTQESGPPTIGAIGYNIMRTQRHQEYILTLKPVRNIRRKSRREG